MRVRPEIMKKRFLELYPLVASIEKTCKILGLISRTVYRWRHDDPDFKREYEIADAMSLGTLEDEATRRAIYGVQRPVYQNGKRVGFVTEYSDTLLIVLLKAKAPHKYKERFAGELTGADGKPLQSANKVIHVYSAVPVASDEDVIQEIPFEMVNGVANQLPPTEKQTDELLDKI